MHEMTAANLRSAYGEESMACIRYSAWSERARQENLPNVARLFKAVAAAEQVHAMNHFLLMSQLRGTYPVSAMAEFGVRSTGENLAEAIAGEEFEAREMYPAYMQTAQLQAERDAQRMFYFTLSAEEIHAAFYAKAKQAVDAGADMMLGPVHVCAACGYIGEGNMPAACPVCSHDKKNFLQFRPTTINKILSER